MSDIISTSVNKKKKKVGIVNKNKPCAVSSVISYCKQKQRFKQRKGKGEVRELQKRTKKLRELTTKISKDTN